VTSISTFDTCFFNPSFYTTKPGRPPWLLNIFFFYDVSCTPFTPPFGCVCSSPLPRPRCTPCPTFFLNPRPPSRVRFGSTLNLLVLRPFQISFQSLRFFFRVPCLFSLPPLLLFAWVCVFFSLVLRLTFLALLTKLLLNFSLLAFFLVSPYEQIFSPTLAVFPPVSSLFLVDLIPSVVYWNQFGCPVPQFSKS